MARLFRALIPLLLFPFLAGCITHDVLLPGLPGESASVSYRLVTTASGDIETIRTFRILVDEQVRSPSFHLRPAYVVEELDSVGNLLSRYWLDGNFNLVRYQSSCLGRDCVVIRWDNAVSSPPLGIGLLAQWNQAGGISLTPYGADAPSLISVEVDVLGDSVKLLVKDGPPELRGMYTFTDDSVFPTRAKVAGATWEQVSRDSVGELPTLPPWPFVAPASLPATPLFPEADRPIDGFEVTPSMALQHLRDQSEEADSMLASGGCLVDLKLVHVHATSSGLVLPFGDVKPTTLVIVTLTDSELARSWQVPWGTDALGDSRFGTPSGPFEDQVPPLPGGCAVAIQSPGSVMSPNAFLAAAAELQIDSPASPDFSFYRHAALFNGEPASFGWARYVLIYYPPGSNPSGSGTFFPNSLVYNAARNALELAQLPSNGVEAFDS